MAKRGKGLPYSVEIANAGDGECIRLLEVAEQEILADFTHFTNSYSHLDRPLVAAMVHLSLDVMAAGFSPGERELCDYLKRRTQVMGIRSPGRH